MLIKTIINKIIKTKIIYIKLYKTRLLNFLIKKVNLII